MNPTRCIFHQGINRFRHGSEKLEVCTFKMRHRVGVLALEGAYGHLDYHTNQVERRSCSLDAKIPFHIVDEATKTLGHRRQAHGNVKGLQILILLGLVEQKGLVW
jgi:hypothetical protein